MQNEKIKKLPHIISSIVILLHSYERFDHGHNSYLVFFFCGLLFFAIAIFHHRLISKFPLIDIIFYIIEGLLALVIAYEYFHAGKKALPFVYLFAALMQCFVVFKFIRRSRNGIGKK
jgi:hypothetical protein